MSALEIRTQLEQLHAERMLAEVEGLGGDVAYMADLDDEIATCTAAWVGAAVTEIATLRAWLHGPLNG